TAGSKPGTLPGIHLKIYLLHRRSHGTVGTAGEELEFGKIRASVQRSDGNSQRNGLYLLLANYRHVAGVGYVDFIGQRVRSHGNRLGSGGDRGGGVGGPVDHGDVVGGGVGQVDLVG